MSLSTTSHEYVVAMGKAAPPLAVTGATAVGWGLQDWVLIATLIYTLLQIALLIRRYVRERFAEKLASKRTFKDAVVDRLGGHSGS